MSVLKYKDPSTGEVKKVGAPSVDAYSKSETDALINTHINNTNNPHQVTAAQIGAVKMETLTQAEYDAIIEKDPSTLYIVTDADVGNDAYILMAQKGVAGGVATLGSDGLVPSSQLPSMGGHYAGDQAPSNTNLLWINTTNNTLNYYDGSDWKAVGAVFG